MRADSTPDAAFSYTRDGRKSTITDAVGTRTFTYNTALQLDQETIDGSSGGLYSEIITRKYETSGVVGRPTGFQAGVTGDLDRDYETTYAYDAQGRLNQVLGPGLDGTNGVRYERVTNGEWIEYARFKDSADADLATIQRVPLGNRNLVDIVENKVGSTTISKYDYFTDSVGRRTFVTNEGTAFASSRHWDFLYNDRNELTGGDRREGTTADTGNAITPSNFDYGYDPIGNRLNTNVDEADPAMGYTANDVNQYTATTGPTESFSYDDDGNLTTDGKYTYVWDAENRLTSVQTRLDLGANPAEPDLFDRLLEFTYDYMGRRVEKKYYLRGVSTWVEQNHQRFIYDGWNVVLVLDGNDSNNVKQKYTWGLDVSGLSGNATTAGIQGAGGIGGLLAAVETGGTYAGAYWFTYDGNGNVGQVLNATSPSSITVAAKYEYDPYGNTLMSSGDYVTANPFRFSTKWLDREMVGSTVKGAFGSTGMYYYGYRYYSPRLGRWISRDPIGERGGLNLLVFVQNNSLGLIDARGLNAAITGGPGHVGIAVDVHDGNCYGVLQADFRFKNYQNTTAQKVESFYGPGEVQISYMPRKKVGEGLKVTRLVKGSNDQDEILLNYIAGTAGITSYYIHFNNRKQRTFGKSYSGQGEWDTYRVLGHSCVAYTDAALDTYLGRDWYVPHWEDVITYHPDTLPGHWNPPPLLYPGDLIAAWDIYGPK